MPLQLLITSYIKSYFYAHAAVDEIALSRINHISLTKLTEDSYKAP